MKNNFILIFVVQFAISAQTFAQFDFFEKKVTIGGYGELHYNYKNQNNEISKVLDFHRFVLFFGYSFSEKWSFNSEVEIEHNFVSNGEGELALEQAFIDYHFKDYLGFQGGVLLASAGLINEYHEPTSFFGVERPSYAKYIIPTTWYGNGFSFYGTAGGFDYKLIVMEGLNSDKFALKSGIRGGRQSGFKSDASSMLYNLRIDYIGNSSLRMGMSVSYNNALGDTSNIPFTLYEAHMKFNKNGFILLGEIGNISYSNSNLMQSLGYYLDFGYDFSKIFNWEWQIIPFLRYMDYNTSANTKNGGEEELKYHHKVGMVGISILPVENVVLKADYSIDTVQLNSVKTNYFNLGLGYRF